MPMGVVSADRRHHRPALAHLLRRRAYQRIGVSRHIRAGSGICLPTTQLHAATDRHVLVHL